jgi:hypothetical protein
MKLRLLTLGSAAIIGLSHPTIGASSENGPPSEPPAVAKSDANQAQDIPPAVSDGTTATDDSGTKVPPPEQATEPKPQENAEDGKEIEPKTPEDAKQGPTVQVENLQTASGPIDPKTVKILAPFPAKPLGTIPSGWRLDASNNAPTFTRKVELAKKGSVVLKIRPQVLIPDGDATFSIQEPGFDPAFGYQQSQTVSHILTNSIRQLDDDSKALGNTIELLEQLLGSLPRPAVPPTAPLSSNKLTDKR